MIDTAVGWEKEETAGPVRKRGITDSPVHGWDNVIAPCEYSFYKDDDSIRLLSEPLRGDYARRAFCSPSGYPISHWKFHWNPVHGIFAAVSP